MKKAKDAYYFPHDSNAVEDPKCIKLLNIHGASGYGFYWILLEKLRQQQNYMLPLDVLKSYARYFNTKEKILLNIITEFDLFVVKDDFFYSESLIKRMKVINRRREQLSKAGKLGNKIKYNKLQPSLSDHQVNTMRQPSESQAIAIKEKKIKVKEIKENIFIKPSLSEIEDYCRHRSNKIDSEKFFNHYESRGWCMGKNNTPMSDWKAAIHNWEKNERNETNAYLGVDERINEFGNRTYGKSGIIVPAEAPPRPTKNHLWSIHDKAWRINL